MPDGYSIFSQLQGPAVPVSLYGDAASQGINAGNALPTPLTAGIQGAIKGVQQGLSIQHDISANAILQHQIDRQPAEDKAQDAANQNAQTIAEINKLKLEADQANQTAEIARTKAVLEQQKIEAQTKADDAVAKNKITDALAKGTAAEKAAILNDPAFSGISIRDPDFSSKIVSSIYYDPAVDPATRQSAKNIWDRNNAVEFAKEREKANIQNQMNLMKGYETAQQDFVTEGVFANAIRGLSPSEYFTKLQVFPKGTKQLGADGKIAKDLNDKLQDVKEDAGRFTVYRDGTPIFDSISKAEADKFYLARLTQDTAHNLMRQQIYGPDKSGILSGAANGAPSQTGQPTQEQQNTTAPGQQGFSLAPDTRAADSNANIVEQKRAQFDALAKNPPPGISAGTLDERLLQKKVATRQGVVAMDKLRGEQIGLLNMMQNIKSETASGSSTPDPLFTRESFLYNNPNEALTAVAKQPVHLNIDTHYNINPVVRDRVNGDPLLAKEPPLIRGMAAIESGGIRDAESPTGVKGLLQVTKSTAAMYGLNRDIPEENVLAAKLYITDIYNRFNGDLRLSLAAYNAGPGMVKHAKELAGTTEWGAVKNELKGLLSPQKYKEVSEYPDKVISQATNLMGVNPDDDQLWYGMLQTSNLIANPEITNG